MGAASLWGLALAVGACGGTTSSSSAPPDGANIVDSTSGAEVSDALDASPMIPRRSCTSGALGAGMNCGESSRDDCCAAPEVTGGAYLRFYDRATYPNRDYPATVSSFRLDRFEVTVGRFRAWLQAFERPVVGAGKHPSIASSGWQPSWPLAADGEALRAALSTDACKGTRTWTNAPAGQEQYPINCVTWFEAFAFCAWEGGRLPTATERNFAAAGGNEQRVYPWSQPPSSPFIDPTRAVYALDIFTAPPLQPVGTRPSGAGRWDHLDLAGNVFEWTLDSYGTGDLPKTCSDCSVLIDGVETRTIEGGAHFNLEDQLLNGNRLPAMAAERLPEVGIRCAY